MEIKNNDGNYWLKSKEVEGLFHELSMEMMKNIVRRLKKRGTADLIDNPYIWQLEKLNDMHLITEENVKVIAKYSGVAEDVFRDVIANEGYKVYQDSHQQLAQALKTNAQPNYLVQDSLDSLAKQTMFEVNNLINTTLPRSLQNNYKHTLEKAVASAVSGTKTHEKALSEAVMSMYQRGFTALKDSGGRTWTVERYAQTVIRTTTFRVYREMRERPADDLGIDTFYYSAKSSARELCAPLQHQIVTKGVARTINGERVLSLPDYGYGSPGGCLGINCGHYLTPFVVGVNYKPELPEYLENLTEEQAKQNALDKARLKAFDREIRINKDKQILAKELGDKELQTKLKLKEITFKTGRKSLIEKNPTVIGKYPQKEVTKKDKKVYNKDTEVKGAIYGAWNDKNDPYQIKRDKHAAIFYEAVRKRDKVLEINAISKNTGFSKVDIEKIYNHVFITEHNLNGKMQRFAPDYNMAESWRRLREGKGIQEHDIVLLQHELMELNLMNNKKLNYFEAHNITQEKYNYEEALVKWFKKGDT